MHQTKKLSAEEAARGEKVRQVLQVAGEPLGPIQVAERIGEDWCMWNGSGRGSAVMKLLRNVGTKRGGKWVPKEPEPTVDIGPTGSLDLMPHHVMPVDSWRRIQAAQKQA